MHCKGGTQSHILEKSSICCLFSKFICCKGTFNATKIFKYVFLPRLRNYIVEYKIIVPNQFGFRPNHNTIDIINHGMQNLMESLETDAHPIGITEKLRYKGNSTGSTEILVI